MRYVHHVKIWEEDDKPKSKASEETNTVDTLISNV